MDALLVSQVFPGFELLGWYTVGSKALPSDLVVHRLVRKQLK